MPAFSLEPLAYRSKPQELCAQLMALAQQLGPETKLPTVTELRQSLGVSLTTLNSALSQLEDRGVIERRHGVGIYVAAQWQPQCVPKAISLVCDPNFFQAAGHSPFWDLLVEQARLRASARDEAFSFHFAVPAGHSKAVLHEGLIDEIKAGRAQGIIAAGLHPSATHWIAEQQVPLVGFACWAPYTVGLDGTALICDAVAELAHQGCHHIGLWRPDAMVGAEAPVSRDEELDVFRQALVASGLNWQPHLVTKGQSKRKGVKPQPVLTKQEQGYHLAHAVFGAVGGAKPDGIVMTDDMMTHGALMALRKLGVQIGHEVKIATHANRGSPVLLGYEDELTLVEIDPSEVVQALFVMLEKLMAGEVPDAPHVLVKPTIKSAAPHLSPTTLAPVKSNRKGIKSNA